MATKATKLAPHGSEAGYRMEKENGAACERCRLAHLEFNRQYTKGGKARGLKYDRYQVITGQDSVKVRSGRTVTTSVPKGFQPGQPENDAAGWGDLGPVSVGARLSSALRDRVGHITSTGRNYVPADDTDQPGDAPPDYLHPVEPDPEPSGDWSQVTPDSTDYVINAAGMAMIENNLGTYLSIIGITIDMIDPYCGPILANNLVRMVEKWAKVISHYPKAAELFMDARGGVLMDWIGALQVTWPFLYAIYEHHLARTVRVSNGNIERKIGKEFQGPVVDATMPPMPDYSFTTEG